MVAFVVTPEPAVMTRSWLVGVRSIRKPTPSPPLAVFQSQMRRYASAASTLISAAHVASRR